MTVEAVEVRKPPVVRRPETDWARARRLRGQAIRTYVSANLDGNAGQTRSGDDWNVVRGED